MTDFLTVKNSLQQAAGIFKSTRSSILMWIFCLVLLSNIFPQSVYANHAEGIRLKVNETIRDFPLQGEINQEDRAYLELGQKGPALSDIACTAILVEVFSIYCPECQSLVQRFNDLYKLIGGHPFCRQNLKMIGIGAGCSDYEVKYFRDFHKVSFPLFADSEFYIHKVLKEPRVPLVFLVKKKSKEFKVLAILDLAQTAEEQFEHLIVKLKTTVALPKETPVSANREILMKTNSHLWDYPNGELIGCLFKGTKVRKIEAIGDWCKVETVANNEKIQGWLHLKQ